MSHDPHRSPAVNDPLALFESEQPAASSGETTAPVASDADRPQVAVPHIIPFAAGHPVGVSQPAPAAPPLTLEEVVARLGALSWPEGVAIVEALCAVIALRGDAVPRVPELPGIAITAAGTVLVAANGVEGAPGAALARRLHALTAGGVLAAPLRLFVTKWTADAGEHSVADFAAELAYFARPDGAALIAAVYSRAAATPKSEVKPQPTPAPKATQKEERRQPRRSRRSAIAVAVIAAAAATGALALWIGQIPGAESAATARVTTVMADAADLGKRLAARVRERVGLAAATSGSESPSTVATQATASGRSQPGRARSARGAAADPIVPAVPIRLPAFAATLTAPLAPAPSAADSELNSAASSSVDAAASLTNATDPAPIYSSADADVQPPELRHPQLPPPLMNGDGADVNTLELIVSESGAVERVRLVTPPKRMADMMLLSGAKAWVFDPASRDGQFVRYRLTLSWTATR